MALTSSVLVIDPFRNAAPAPLMVLGRDVSTQPPVLCDLGTRRERALSYRTGMKVSSGEVKAAGSAVGSERLAPRSPSWPPGGGRAGGRLVRLDGWCGRAAESAQRLGRRGAAGMGEARPPL